MRGLEMKYYVLNPNKNTPYGAASRLALETYADAISQENWQLSKDLKNWVRDIRERLGKKNDERIIESVAKQDIVNMQKAEELRRDF